MHELHEVATCHINENDMRKPPVAASVRVSFTTTIGRKSSWDSLRPIVARRRRHTSAVTLCLHNFHVISLLGVLEITVLMSGGGQTSHVVQLNDRGYYEVGKGIRGARTDQELVDAIIHRDNNMVRFFRDNRCCRD
jgi:hypothetical protein